MFFIITNPSNTADGMLICLENPFRGYVFAQYSDFVLDPDILAYTPLL